MNPPRTAGFARVLSDVIEERERQDRKWGPQDHPPLKWVAILTEEVGEVAQEALECEPTGAWALRERRRNYRAELVQVAAVAFAALEAHDRAHPEDRP